MPLRLSACQLTRVPCAQEQLTMMEGNENFRRNCDERLSSIMASIGRCPEEVRVEGMHRHMSGTHV